MNETNFHLILINWDSKWVDRQIGKDNKSYNNKSKRKCSNESIYYVVNERVLMQFKIKEIKNNKRLRKFSVSKLKISSL